MEAGKSSGSCDGSTSSANVIMDTAGGRLQQELGQGARGKRRLLFKAWVRGNGVDEMRGLTLQNAAALQSEPAGR